MTLLSLRKRDPEPEPDGDVEDGELDEAAEDDDGQEPEPEGRPLGLLPALYQGVRGWCAWCSGRISAGGTLGVHITALYAAEHYNTWVTVGLTAGFVLAVSLFTPPEAFDRVAARLDAYDAAREARREAAHEPDDELVEGAPGEPPVDHLPALMWRLIGDASGVHLKTLTEALARAAEKEGEWPPTKAEVEAALMTRGIALRDSVRDARGKVNKGVHRDDLEAWQKARSSTQNTPPLQARSSTVGAL